MLLGIANVFFAFGLSKIVFQELNEPESQSTGGSVLYATLILGFFGSLIFLFFSDLLASFFDNPHLSPLIRIYGFSLLFTLVSELLRSVLTHYYRSNKIAVAAMLHNFLRVGIIFYSIHYLESITYLFIGLLILEVLNALYLFFSVPKGQLLGRIKIGKIKENLYKGFPLALSGAATILLVQTDGVMISRMLGTEKYAIYRMGAIPIPFLFIVFSSVIRVTLSEVNKLYADKKLEALIVLKKKSSAAIAYISYPPLIFFLVFAEPFIGFYLGEKYAASIVIFMIYNLLLFLRINDFRDILIAAAKTKEIFYIDLVILVFNAIMNYILIRLLGIKGAAIASISSYFLLSAILQYRTTSFLKIPFFSFFNTRKMFKILVLCLPLALLTFLLYNSFASIPMLGVSGTLYIVLSYWLLLRFKVIEYDTLMHYSENISILKPMRYIISKLK